MNILGTTSASLSKDIENAISAFTKTITKLETTVANQAENLASKIKALLS